MNRFANISRVARALALVAAGLLVAACARTPGASDLATASLTMGKAAPGTSQDFVVNVGDRIFFETDSTQFTPIAIATLNKQITWLSQYGRYAFTI